MRYKLKNLVLSNGIGMLFALLLIACSVFFWRLDLHDRFMLVFFSVLIFGILPAVSYYREVVDSIISPIRYSDLYVHTVDSILNIQSFDEVLKKTFDQILNLIGVQVGFLIFYYNDKNEFNIFYQKNKRSKVIRNARISHDNILIKSANGPDDIIVKGKLDPVIHYERELIEELEKLGGEVVVPIYFHEMFQGLIIVGARKKRFTNAEIRLLKIFASKIAVLSVNSFYFNELVKKKELEKEYELATSVQKKFLPESNVSAGRVVLHVFHQAASLMIREFYDIYRNDVVEDDIRISAYRILGDITGTSIIMPGIQSVLQSFARMGFAPPRVISRLKMVARERNLEEKNLILLHGSLRQNGEFIYCNSGYPAPLLYKSGTGRIAVSRRLQKSAAQRLRLEAGDVLIISCEFFSECIRKNAGLFGDVISRNAQLPLQKLGSVMSKALVDTARPEPMDMLLILARVEAGS